MTDTASVIDTLQPARDLGAAGIAGARAEAIASRTGEAADAGRADPAARASPTAADAAFETRIANRRRASVDPAAGFVIAATRR